MDILILIVKLLILLKIVWNAPQDTLKMLIMVIDALLSLFCVKDLVWLVENVLNAIKDTP